ncbi:MAG: hypothetical protein WCG47_13080, partial [Dermatophilaceae bacterium]
GWPHWDAADLGRCVVRLNLLIFMAREDRFVALGCADRRVSFDDAMLLLGDQLTWAACTGCWPSTGM